MSFAPIFGGFGSGGASGGGYDGPNPAAFTSVEYLHSGASALANEESDNARAMSYGSVLFNSTQTLFGQNTCDFNGAIFNLSSHVNAFELASGDFVLEIWTYPTGTAGGTLAAVYHAPQNDRNWQLAIDDTSGSITGLANALRWTAFPNASSTAGAVGHVSTTGLTRNAWNYVALMRSGDNHYLYVGPEGGTVAANLSANSPSTVRPSGVGVEPLKFGNLGSGGDPYPGRISEARLTLGDAFMPTSNFSAPTQPFPRS